jgi:tetratricopeptide (TPR) repeat protein
MLNTKYLLLIIILLSIFSCEKTSKADSYTYGNYKANQRYRDFASEKYDEGAYEEAIDLYNEVKAKKVFEIFKYNGIGKCYAKLGMKDSALVNLQKAIRIGFDSTYFDKVLFEDFYGELVESYPENHLAYLNSVDIELRHELLAMTKLDQYVRNRPHTDDQIEKVDSINLVKLDSIVAINGWPSPSLIGLTTIFEQVSPSLIIIHSDKETNLRYLDIVKKSCDNGDENWYTLNGVYNNLLFRHCDVDKPMPVYYLHVDESMEKIDTVKSDYIIDFLSGTLKRNKSFDFHLFPTENMDNIQQDNLLDQLTSFLVARGIDKDRIHLHLEEVVQSDSDSLMIYMAVDY